MTFSLKALGRYKYILLLLLAAGHKLLALFLRALVELLLSALGLGLAVVERTALAGDRGDVLVLFVVLVYLHHGGGENETGWIWQGKINYIADNLIADGLCEEMIIVMTCLYDIDYDHPDEFLAGDFDRLLTQDCIPLIEERYRVIPEPAFRAICGLSMGSYHSAQIACNHPGMFAYVGMLSGSFDQRWYGWCDCRAIIAQNAAFREGTRCFFLSVGTEEERIYQQIQENVAYLKASGVACAYFECPGLHEWTVWRKSIREFMKLLFR